MAVEQKVKQIIAELLDNNLLYLLLNCHDSSWAMVRTR